MNKLKKGIYRHYKGEKYYLLGEAQSATDKDKFVVYKSLRDGLIWIRPYQDFLSKVDVSGKKELRFKFLNTDKNNKEETDNKKDSCENKYKRALADYHNLLKQSAREKEEFIKYSLTDILNDILPVYDHLKMSLAGLDFKEVQNPWVVGVKHVLKEFQNILLARGVEEIKTNGEKFDHNTMEAVAGSGDKVKQEIMPGYKLNGRLIKAAKVIVK